jgi:hypothetical protein
MVFPGVAASVFAQVIDFDVVKSKSPSHGNFGLYHLTLTFPGPSGCSGILSAVDNC